MGNPEAPVAVGTAGAVHFCVTSKTAEVLDGQNGKAGTALPQTADEMVTGWALRASLLPLIAEARVIDIF
ncbi:hypothetical protein SDC9_212098 [bioreactor metagenome]|uniref:Uncharacterized protein n=1 Tax=bioreactor metagenome TaxID=1076179 RepID=A0A645JLN7_9ZZZZ